MLTILIFTLCVLGIEFFIFYNPLYYIGYKILSIDKKIGEVTSAILLTILTLILSILFFNQIGGLIYSIFF